MEIRRYTQQDYGQTFELWERCGLSLGKSDSEVEMLKLVKFNPETSLVGLLNGKIIACVFGGYDGRRGLVHHLAVDPEYQRKGYGKIILEALEEKFRELGVVKMSFWVFQDNHKALEFYKQLGYELREDIVTMSKSL